MAKLSAGYQHNLFLWEKEMYSKNCKLYTTSVLVKKDKGYL